ncbi:MAG: hypothetical protein EBZ48_01255 [Proteobacteria bacterium]|nr:hypothetical protein [Pseudomonadota bacterium]
MGKDIHFEDSQTVMDTPGSKSRFSANFLSLQLQLKTLLEESGGDELMPFLDALSTLNRSEQKILLKLLARTIEKVVATTPRFETAGDLALKNFEDALYHDIANALDFGHLKEVPCKRIEVLEGGKEIPSNRKAPIDLATARKRKRLSSASILN